MQAIHGLAAAGDRAVLPYLLGEIDFQADDDEPCFWWDTFEAVEAMPDAALLPHLQRLRETMSREGLADYWMKMVDDAIAACSAETVQAE